MTRRILVLSVALVVATSGFAVAEQARTGGVANEPRATTCGTAYYDDGSSEGGYYFGGGQAGDPDFMMGVIFSLADFGWTAGDVEVTGFCTGNDIDYTSYGGPWPNEVFIYPDNAGTPNDSVILGQGTINTGDGGGQYEVPVAPATLNGDFWVIVRGYPAHAGEDFNVEGDDTGPGTNSMVSGTGIGDLAPNSFGVNYVIRAEVQAAGLPTPTPDLTAGSPVPTLNRWGIMAFLVILAGVAVLLIHRGRA